MAKQKKSGKRLARLLRPGMELYFVFLFGFCLFTLLVGQYILASIQLAASSLLLAAYLLDRRDRDRRLGAFAKKLTNMESGVRNGQNPFPLLVLRMDDASVIYGNEAFHQAIEVEDGIRERAIEDIIPGFQTGWLLEGRKTYNMDVRLGSRRYRIHGTTAKADDSNHTLLALLYFVDLTELYQVRDEYIRSRPVVSIILVDNYDTLTRGLTESGISTLDAKINDAILSWTENYHGLLRRLEKNRFLFVFEKRDLKGAKEGKFSLVEDMHELRGAGDASVSISFGLGVDGETFEESYGFATQAIDMALSRGGDQAVVKDRHNYEFFGGSTRENENRSRVSSRVEAKHLVQLLSAAETVFIMGHKNADLDSVGAAMGICCLCRKLGKEFHVVLDVERNAAKLLIDQIRGVEQYRNLFISGEKAMMLCNSNSVLVIVDTNRPDQVEYRPLLDSIAHVSVIDHHRRAADYINPVAVENHDPSASSAGELVTEMLQYVVDPTDLLPIEAKALLAGIFLDTKSFQIRTRSRTFDAVAFLRKLGASPVEVKLLMQNNFDETLRKYAIIQKAQIHAGEHAIAVLEEPSTRVLAAQAADELLNISGISSSYVIYPDGEQVIVSARSIGNMNVQVILEPLGGGGNAATAGAQIKGKTPAEVGNLIRKEIDQFIQSY